MSDGGRAGHPGTFHGKSRAYDKFEICLCCILWPTVAIASGTLLYWFWIDNPNSPSLSAKLASMIFVVVFIAAAICTIDQLTSVALRVFRRPRRTPLPHPSPSPDDASFV